MIAPGTASSVVVDASALVALLVDAGPAGDWVAEVVQGAELAAPHLVLFETANVLRRQLAAGTLPASDAALAHADLLALPLELWPYEALAERVWELRATLTAYDASYVALAERLGAPVVTLDARLAGAPGSRCEVRAYAPAGSGGRRSAERRPPTKLPTR